MAAAKLTMRVSFRSLRFHGREPDSAASEELRNHPT